MRPRHVSVYAIATLLLLALLSAAVPKVRAVVEYDRKRAIQHPQDPRGPHYYGYSLPLSILPGTRPKRKCIPNGQARCMDTIHTRHAVSRGSSRPSSDADIIDPIIKEFYNYYNYPPPR